MTENQRKAIEILNDIKAKKCDDRTPIICDDDYFFLLSFIVDKQPEQYVPQIYPQTWPYAPCTNPIFRNVWVAGGTGDGQDLGAGVYCK